MASLSALTFVEPHMSYENPSGDKEVTFVDLSLNASTRVWLLTIRNTADGLVIKGGVERESNGSIVMDLPHKFAAAMYRAAVLKGYAQTTPLHLINTGQSR